MRIPSTQALRALDSFARHGSVWRAADELNLTRSAVSHQLRLLERDLGFVLLERAGRHVTLTPRGRHYASAVRNALTVLGDATARHAGKGVGGTFTVSCTPGFASQWLCPHIDDFQRSYPEVLLRVVTPRRLDEVSNPEVDLFIAFSDGNWPNRAVELLYEVAFTPLCSPGLATRAGGFSRPADLLRATLLHLRDTEEWSLWMAMNQIENSNPDAGIIFSDLNLVMSAAMAGQGVALGDELTNRKALLDGRLVRPFEKFIKSPRSYFLVHEHAKADHPVLGAFAAWMRARMSDAEQQLYG